MELLRFIYGYQQAKGYSPLLREMAAALGCAAKSIIYYRLGDMEERGLIRRAATHWQRFDRRKSIEVLVPPAIPRAPDGAPLYAVPGFGEGQ